MPLSNSDVQYLNKLLDRHLANQRPWPWLRIILLMFPIILIAFASWSFFHFSHFPQFQPADLDLPPSLIKSMEAAPDQPVTNSRLLSALKSAHSKAEFDAGMNIMMSTLFLSAYLGSLFLILLSIKMLAFILSHWNHHRRDTLLITLLREKFAAELTLPTAPPNPN